MKKKDSETLVRFIYAFLRLQPWKFILMFVCSLVWSAESTLWPYLLRRIIDIFTLYDDDRGEAWPALKWLLIFAILLIFCQEFLFRSRDFILAWGFPKLEADIRLTMFDHIQHHSPKYFNTHFSGRLANQISDMTTHVTRILHILVFFINALATSIISFTLFLDMSPLFSLILGGWIVLHFAVCFAFTKKCASYSNIHGEARSTLVGQIVDSLTNNYSVNLFYRFQFEKSLIAGYQREERKLNYQAQRSVALLYLSQSVFYIACVVVMNLYMITCWVKRTISTGEAIQIFNTTWNVTTVLWHAGDDFSLFFESIGIAHQALSVMKDPEDLYDTQNAQPLVIQRGEIIFENVSFCYGNKKVFHYMNVHIKRGEKVGLVGHSSAGKSTFVNLILRFYPVEQGKIYVDGQNIAEGTLESLRSQVAMIPQDPLLFHRSLEDNIRYGRIDASQEEVVQASKRAHCHEFVSKIPDGYGAKVGERGTKLSGGERQRIAIARAMLSGAPILILDEATSALDSMTERYIQDSLEKLMPNKTTVVIAHRLSTLAKMDRILVFEGGKIIEEGSHVDLLAMGGHYAHMWQMQAGGFLAQ